MKEKEIIDKVHIPMMCVCNSEGRVDADALREEVKLMLSGGSEELNAREVTDANFLTCVVVSLNWDYEAYIKSINNDMWSSVSAEKTISYGDTHRVATFYVECDRIEDGIAAIYKAVSEYKNV